MTMIARLVPLALLVGFSIGEPVSPNYRWCAAQQAKLKCFASEAACKASKSGWCEIRLVAEPMRGAQPAPPR